MSQNRRPYFKLSITNLVLVNEVYPFDFFLRFRTANSQQYQDSPIILAHQGECEELFPWEFATPKSQIRVEFVELSSNTRVEIQRGQHVIDGLTDEDGQTVAILANRTAKKLCLITYILQPYSPPNKPRQQQKQPEQSRFEGSESSQSAVQVFKQKGSNPELAKSERDQLSQQIAQINRSIDKILDHEKMEHAVFSKYLNQSTSFIREIMNNTAKDYDKSRVKSVDDTDMQPSTNNHNSMLKEISQSEENSNEEMTSKKWYKQKYNKEQPQILRNKGYIKQKSSQKPGAESAITYEKQESSAAEQNNMQESTLILSDICFNTEVKPSEVIFTNYHNKSTVLKMKTPNEGIFEWKKPIQLPSLPFVLVTAIGKNAELQGCIAKKQFEHEKVFLFDQKGQPKGFMKFKCKILQIFSVQTHDILDVNRNEVETDEQQKPNENESDKPSTEKSNQQDGKPIQKEDYQIYKIQIKDRSSKRASKLREMRQQEKERYDEKKDAADKEQSKQQPMQRTNRCDLVSNSIAISYLPFLRKEVNSEKERNPRSSFMSESRFSSASSSQFLSRIKLANIKIDSISVKLERNKNEFVGKFIKLSMRNKQPFVTETINLSQNLTWKGKGYIFQNISPFAELRIDLFNAENNNQVCVGTAKVCLALLNMQKQKSAQFYHQYVRDENENQIGELILGYESFDKNRNYKVSSVNRFRDDGLSEHNEANEESHKPIIVEKKKPKAKSNDKLIQKAKANPVGSEPTNRTEKKNKIGQHSSQAKSLVGETSAIRSKKYTGGNIIIGRAARFRAENPNRLGPGDYEVPSTFERHIEPT